MQADVLWTLSMSHRALRDHSKIVDLHLNSAVADDPLESGPVEVLPAFEWKSMDEFSVRLIVIPDQKPVIFV